MLGDAYVDTAMANVDDFNRDFQRIVTQYCWGEAWGDDTLQAARALDPQPRHDRVRWAGWRNSQTHVRGALNNGLTPNEIRAVLTQIAVYCGIPTGVDCFRLAKPIIEHEKNKK